MMAFTRSPFLALKLFTLLTLPALTGLAQDTPQVFESMDVRLQQIQVNVATRQGDPIRNLTKEDFEILLSGKKQTIVALSEISLDDEAQKEVANVPQMARRLFIFFFDLRHTTRLGLLNARKSAGLFLQEKFLPIDLGMVATFHPDKGIEVLCQITSDAHSLLQAVDTLGLVTTTQRGRAGYFNSGFVAENAGTLGNLNSQIDQIFSAGIESTETGIGGNEDLESLQFDQEVLEHIADILQRAQRAEEDVYRADVNRFLLQFQGFGNALRQIHGRKNLIWFSSGFDEKILTGNSDRDIQKDSDAISRGEIWNVSTDSTGNVGIQSNLKDAVEFLQNSNTMIFAVDTSLNENSTSGQSGLQSLNVFSKDTGGRLFRNSNDLSEPLSQIRDITSHYYLISFEPTTNLDLGEAHKLKIKTQAKGAQIFANKTLILAPKFADLSPLEKQMQLSDYLARDVISNAIPTRVETYPVPGANNLEKLVVTAEIQDTYYRNDPNTELAMEVIVQAVRIPQDFLFDASYYRFAIGKDTLADKNRSGILFLTDLFLAPGNYRLKTVFRDLNTGKVGSQIRELKVEPHTSPLAGPYIMENPAKIIVRASEESQKTLRGDQLDYSYPFTINSSSQIPGKPTQFSLQKSYGFFFFIDKKATNPVTENPKMNAFLMDENKQPISIPADAISAGHESHGKEPFLVGLMVYLDFSKIKLTPNKTYQLFTQFLYDKEDPYRNIATLHMVP